MRDAGGHLVAERGNACFVNNSKHCSRRINCADFSLFSQFFLIQCLRSVDTWGWITLLWVAVACMEGCLAASLLSTPRCLCGSQKTSPDIAKCPPRGKITPVENCCIYLKVQALSLKPKYFLPGRGLERKKTQK